MRTFCHWISKSQVLRRWWFVCAIFYSFDALLLFCDAASLLISGQNYFPVSMHGEGAPILNHEGTAVSAGTDALISLLAAFAFFYCSGKRSINLRGLLAFTSACCLTLAIPRVMLLILFIGLGLGIKYAIWGNDAPILKENTPDKIQGE